MSPAPGLGVAAPVAVPVTVAVAVPVCVALLSPPPQAASVVARMTAARSAAIRL
jgi:hypothetical protein